MVNAVGNDSSGAPTASAVVDESDSTAMTLAQALVGDGVKVVSAKMEGDAKSFGFFANAESIVGFDKGLVLSTGYLFQGENSIFDGGYEQQFSMETEGGDYMGTEIAGFDPEMNFYDYTMLEFTYIPEAENVSFQYCVASEEYPEYISSYFDQFVLLVNGTNYALVPETGEMVTIGTVNHLNNSKYYRGITTDSEDGAISKTNFVFDGITTTFSVSAKVNPNVENTIRIAIADKGDSVYDSAVFIKAGSVKEKEATPGAITVGAVDGNTMTLDRNEGSDGFVGVDVIFQDVNKEVIGKENVTFNDGETQKDVTIPENVVYFFLSATAGGVTVAPEVVTAQNIESFVPVTSFGIAGKVIAESAAIFDATVSGGDATVSGGDATVSGGDATVSDGDAAKKTEKTEPIFVAGAEVLLKGNGVSRTALTDENGDFSFKNLKKGVYQIKVTKENKSGTAIVKVDASGVACTVELHKGSDSVDTGDANVYVGGLNELISADSPVLSNEEKAIIEAGGFFDLSFKASKLGDSDSAVESLKQATGKSFDAVYDFTIKKQVKTVDGAEFSNAEVHETGKLISVVIPMQASQKGLQNYQIYRVHNGITEVISETPNADGEYIEVLQDEGVVILHVSKFSTYTSVTGTKTANNNNSNNNANTDNGETRTEASAGEKIAPKTGETDTVVMSWIAIAGLMAGAAVFGKKAFKGKRRV